MVYVIQTIHVYELTSDTKMDSFVFQLIINITLLSALKHPTPTKKKGTVICTEERY